MLAIMARSTLLSDKPQVGLSVSPVLDRAGKPEALELVGEDTMLEADIIQET